MDGVAKVMDGVAKVSSKKKYTKAKDPPETPLMSVCLSRPYWIR